MTPQKGYVWFLPAWLAPDWWNPNHSHLDGDTSEGIPSIPCSAADMKEFVSGGYFSLSNAFYGEDLDTILSGGTVNQWRQEYERRVKNQVISAVYTFSCIQSLTLTLSLSRSLALSLSHSLTLSLSLSHSHSLTLSISHPATAHCIALHAVLCNSM